MKNIIKRWRIFISFLIGLVRWVCRRRQTVMRLLGVKSLDGQEKPLTEGAGEAKEGTGKPNPNNVKVSQGHQDKHIPGTNNYKQSVANGQNRSILNKNPQQLLDGHAGTGTSMGANKEWVDFGKVIGQYYDTSTGTYVDTTKGIIHYNSKGGAHIVPSNPKGMR